MKLLNIFNSGGLWLIPFATLIMFIVQLYRTFSSGKTTEPIYKTAQFKWAMCWLVATIILFIWLAVDYKGV